MSDLREIYQEVILDHYRKPRNYAVLDDATRDAKGHNPLCGDRIQVYLQVEGDLIEEISFHGAGCAISTASASLMTEAVKGKSIQEALQIFESFHNMMTVDEPTEADLGKLEALTGVRQVPVRIKCATLAWHTLKAALQEESSDNATVSTE